MKDFEETKQSFSLTFPIICSVLRINDCVMIEHRPCKVIDINTLETGENGQTSIQLVGLDIFTNEKYEDTFKSAQIVAVPYVNRNDFQLIDISEDGCVTLINEGGDTKVDLRLPVSELGTKIRDKFARKDETVIVTVLSAVGQEEIIACKNTN